MRANEFSTKKINEAPVSMTSTYEQALRKMYRLEDDIKNAKKLGTDKVALRTMEKKLSGWRRSAKKIKDEIESYTHTQSEVEKEIKKARRQGIDTAHASDRKWYQDVTSLLKRLGLKAQSFEIVSDEELADAVSKKEMTSKQRTQFKNKQKNAEAFARDLGQSILALFQSKLHGRQPTKLTKTKIFNFLKAARTGALIDNKAMVGQDSGNIKEFFDPQYQEVFDELGEEFFTLKPPAAGSANIGPGELALAMLGNPSAKATKGDIDIGGEMYEIKAGKGNIGGRFNSSEVGKANTGWQTWTTGIEQIMQNAGQGKGYSANEITPAGKKASKYNFNNKGISNLNAEVLEPYSDPAQTIELLTNTFQTVVKNYNEIKDFDKSIVAMVNSDGTIKDDYMETYAKILYDSYHLADGVTNILIIDTNNLDYAIVRNDKQLTDQIGKTFKPSGGFNWNDGQQTASPQFVTVK